MIEDHFPIAVKAGLGSRSSPVGAADGRASGSVSPADTAIVSSNGPQPGIGASLTRARRRLGLRAAVVERAFAVGAGQRRLRPGGRRPAAFAVDLDRAAIARTSTLSPTSPHSASAKETS